ncbi:MAG TPA: SHOCT domain-containing protein [Bacteroidales bacterium]|nr:SHOCT domain-containing protein [Bacteroidales bacterium]
MAGLLQSGEMNDLTITLGLIVVLLIAWIFLRRMGKRDKRSFRSTSLRNLRQRYLRGEISDEEYEKQKKDLEAE